MSELSQTTKYFFELTPERILDAVESAGIRCTGRCLALNSMENRVYEVEVDIDDESTLASPSDRFRIIKFYRPGRWTKEQIADEHQFLFDLQAAEIPVVAPLGMSNGSTIEEISEIGIFFSIFPKQGGRSPDEFAPGHAQQIGRLLARTHAVGALKQATHRLTLNPQTYGLDNLSLLLELKQIPLELEKDFSNVVHDICAESQTHFHAVPAQRIHGDCHFGNILWGRDGAFLIDFDDMVMGPCVQDLWISLPGDDDDGYQILQLILEGYEEMRSFDRHTLRLIEPLRALRMIHFSAWIAKRWQDPAFKRSFPHFGTQEYWRQLIDDLHDQLDIIREENDGKLIWG